MPQTLPFSPFLDLSGIPFVRARNFTRSNRKAVDLIVLHSMESQEKPGTARAVADWFAGVKAPPASAHYCVDAGAIVQCVRDEDIAWHAPGANSNGIGIEHAGRASQTLEDWMDTYSRLMLERSIGLCIALCKKWDIPPVIVTPEALRLQGQGITTHAYVSEAFKRSTHTDPGKNFPLAWYVSRVAEGLR